MPIEMPQAALSSNEKDSELLGFSSEWYIIQQMTNAFFLAVNLY